MMKRKLLLGALAVSSIAMMPLAAPAAVNVYVDVAPPAPRYEVVPPARAARGLRLGPRLLRLALQPLSLGEGALRPQPAGLLLRSGALGASSRAVLLRSRGLA